MLLDLLSPYDQDSVIASTTMANKLVIPSGLHEQSNSEESSIIRSTCSWHAADSGRSIGISLEGC